MMGYLTKDTEIKYVRNQTPLATNSLATNRYFKRENGDRAQETCFVDISVFGKAGLVMKEKGMKGSRVLIEGRMMFSQWRNAETNAVKNKHSVVVESLQLLDYKGKHEQDNANNGNSNNGGANLSNQQMQEKMFEMQQQMQTMMAQMQQNNPVANYN